MKYLIIALAIISGNFDTPSQIAELEKTAQNDRFNYQVRLELAEIYLDQDNYSAAQRYLCETDTIFAGLDSSLLQGRLLYLWGLYYDKQDNIPKAIEKYQAALEQDSTIAKAWRQMGYIHDIFSDGAQMLYCFEHALLFTDDSAGVYYDMGIAYDYLDSLQRAIESYHDALDINPMIFEAYLNLGVDLSSLGYPDSANYYFQKADSAGLNGPELYYNLGMIAFDGGQIDQSLDNFMHVLALDPDYTPAKYMLGNVYEAVGDSGMAKLYYQEFVDTAPMLYLDNINEVKEKLSKYNK